MLYAGISWHQDYYQLAVIGPDGQRVIAPGGYYASHNVHRLVARLRELELTEPVTIAVESTNGTLDGRLMAAGLRVHRADPGLLPERPAFGAVQAEDIARACLRYEREIVPLQRHRGTQTGREGELAGWIAGAADADRAQAASGRLFHRGAGDRREVALTFDDGPLPPYTEMVLDILARYELRATFFCCGIHVRGNAAELVRMREEGHAIGNHTWSHPFLPELTRAQVAEQVIRTGDAIAEAAGTGRPTLFRPPYAGRTPQVLEQLAGLGVTTILGDVAPDDWAPREPDAVARDVLAGVRPGSVVLLNDGGGERSATLAALPRIIEGLLDDGYAFARVDDMALRAEQARLVHTV
ncbi:MAG TPA: polysaccharide deacetylase family protein [Trebonia sp.]|jgi:peptidoglycan/xylan/chitin deacetylase (PgdA/CDA1 family)|nr:polysaccharide deacetylase family protein [Trebonia sp.]